MTVPLDWKDTLAVDDDLAAFDAFVFVDLDAFVVDLERFVFVSLDTFESVA